MISSRLRTAAAWALLLVASSGPTLEAFAADPNKLESIEVQTLSGQQVQLKLHLSGPASAPLPFTIDKPARIAFDLPNTTLAVSSRRVDVHADGVESVLAAEANGRTRLVVNVDAMLPYSTQVDGSTITILLGNNQGDAVADAAAPVAGAGAAPLAGSGTGQPGPAAAARAIRSIDFRRGPDGTGRVIVQLTDPRTPVNVRQEGNQVVVDFSGTLMPKNLMRRYDVTDFATPVQTVDALRVEGISRLVISAVGDFDQLAYQSDNQYTIEVKPSLKRTAADEKKEYTGERLTLNFQDIDVRSVLQLLADTSGQNIVVSDSVTGNLTLRLQNVPWDQALDIVLRTKGLDKRREGNVIIIGPTEELANREKAELAARREVQDLSPVHSEYLQVNYAKVADLAKLIKSTNAKESMLSTRGSLSIDDRTNTLLVQDTTEKLAEIRRLVQALDVPVRQVLIEARVVVVSDTFERDLGAQLGISTSGSAGANLFSVSGTAAATDGIVSTAATGATSTNALTSATLANRYQVNLPAANVNGSFGLSLLSGSHLIDLQLTAAQNEGRSETIAAPRVITANQKQATILQGTEIPYQESASSGATTTQFKDAVLSLKVTPLITPDNRVVMDIDVSDDSVGQQVTSATGGSVPSIDTRKIVTQVLVNDGQTVVLGGILSTTKTKSSQGVPYLANIPVLGHLFKTTTDVNNKSELLIFITPKILREGSNLY